MKKYKSFFSLALALALVISVCASCSDHNGSNQPPLASGSVIVADDSIPDRAPNIKGVVTSVTYVREGITMLVEVPGNNDAYADGGVYVTLTSRTVVETENKQRFKDYTAISPGDTVSVWYYGSSTTTSPEYAMAQGVRVTSRVEDLLLTVRLNNTTIMASPAEADVTSTDIKPLLYGSYLVYTGEGNLYIDFTKKAMAVSGYAAALKEGGSSYHMKANAESMTCEIPANMAKGEYNVTLKVDYEDGADYYMFTLSIQ